MSTWRRVLALCAFAFSGASGCLSDEGCPKFAHIAAVDFGRAGETLWWTLRVEELPKELTFNQLDVPAGFLEYRWAVELDSDYDGAVDLRVSIDHFAASGGLPITTADILSQTNENIRAVTGGMAEVIGPIVAAISAKNTFRFETTTATAAGLASVTDRAQSTWLTVYRSGAAPEDQCDERFRAP
jgi:hypothetical protein